MSIAQILIVLGLFGTLLCVIGVLVWWINRIALVVEAQGQQIKVLERQLTTPKKATSPLDSIKFL